MQHKNKFINCLLSQKQMDIETVQLLINKLSYVPDKSIENKKVINNNSCLNYSPEENHPGLTINKRKENPEVFNDGNKNKMFNGFQQHNGIATINSDGNENKKDDIIHSVAIIGDSMLNNIEGNGISNKGNVKVLPIPGATSYDMKDHVNPIINRKPDILILHVGSNDLTKNADTIPNLQSIVDRCKKKSAYTKIAISSLITRKDIRNGETEVIKLNDKLKAFCVDNLTDFIDNDNIDESCLGKKGLHPNKKGKSYIANNFINYLKSCK